MLNGTFRVGIFDEPDEKKIFYLSNKFFGKHSLAALRILNCWKIPNVICQKFMLCVLFDVCYLNSHK